MDGGLVADGEFVISGGHGSVAFEPVDATFHGMALLVSAPRYFRAHGAFEAF
jgi:hypothetical protein